MARVLDPGHVAFRCRTARETPTVHCTPHRPFRASTRPILAALVGALVLVGCSDPSADVDLAASVTSPPREGSALDESPDESPDDSIVTSPPRDAAALCDAAQRIRDLDGRSSAIMSEVFGLSISGEAERADQAFTEAIAELEGLLPDLDAAYASMREAVPPELQGGVDALRSFTTDLMRKLSETATLDGFRAAARSISADAAGAVTQATADLHALTRDVCDIDLTG